MKTRTVTVCEGEWLGPVDWNCPDFTSCGWNVGGTCNPELIEPSIAALRAAIEGMERGEEWLVCHHGYCHPILRIGMWGSWPHWEPHPTVLYRTSLGAETTSWFGITTKRMPDAAPNGAPSP